MENLAKIFRQMLPIVIFVGLWEILARFQIFTAHNLFPPFSIVITETYTLFLKGMMTDSLLSTLFRVLIGLFVGCFLGISIGTIMG